MIKKRLLICADDFGMSHAINHAIFELAQKKKLSATSCMTNYPAWPDGAKQLKELSEFQIGLHFNLKTPSLPNILLKSYCRLINKKLIRSELEKQYNAFVDHMGKKPDFIDGHQHIHQLPIIRDVLLEFYSKHLKNSATWIRSTQNTQTHWKAHVINLLGGSQFDRMLKENRIPHNPDFSGIYTFSQSREYEKLLTNFLESTKEDGLIMCHPGLKENFRIDEYQTLLNHPHSTS